MHKLGNFFNCKLKLDLLNSVVPHALLELVSVHTHVLEISIKRNALLCKSVLVVLNVVLKLIVIHNLGNLAFNEINNLFKNCALEVSLNVLFLLLGKLRLDFLLKFCKSIDLIVNILCKIVIKSRKLLHLDFVENNLEYSVLARKFGGVLGRECNVYVELVAGLVTDNLLLKAGNKLTRTESKLIVLTLAAVKSNAVNKALKVDNSDIVLLSLSVINRNNTGVSFLH